MTKGPSPELQPLPGHPKFAASPPCPPSTSEGPSQAGLWSCCRWPGGSDQGTASRSLDGLGIVALWGVHRDRITESHPCRTRIFVTPSSCGVTGLVEQLLGGPWVPIASCHVPTAPGEVVQLLLLGQDPWGLLVFFFAVGCGILGTALGAVQAPSPRLLRLLNLLFTAGKGEGGELGRVLLSSPSQKKKKVPSPLTPSLAPGSLSLEAGWSFGSLGIRVGFQENLGTCCYSLGCISTLPGQGFGITLVQGPGPSQPPPPRLQNFAAHLSWKSNYCIFCIVVVDPVRVFL